MAEDGEKRDYLPVPASQGLAKEIPVPIQLPNEQASRWKVVLALMGAPLSSIGCFALSQYLQARGLVSIPLARMLLAVAWLCISAALYISVRAFDVKRRAVTFIGSLLVAVILVSLEVWATLRASPLGDYKAFIDCEDKLLPVDVQSPDMYILVPHPTYSGPIKTSKTNGGLIGLWPSAEVKPLDSIEKCWVQNLTGVAMVDATVGDSLTFWKVEHLPPNTLHMTSPFISTQQRIDIPILSSGGRFDFYIQNTGPNAVVITWAGTMFVNGKNEPIGITNRARVLTIFPKD